MKTYHNSRTLITWLITLLVAPLFNLPATAQTFFKAAAKGSDLNPARMFDLTAPGGTLGAARFVVAKFILKPTDKPHFRVAPVSLGNYGGVDFTTNDVKSVTDLHHPGQAADVFASEIATGLGTSEDSPAPGYRLITLNILFKVGHEYSPPELWRVELLQPATAADTDRVSGFWMEGPTATILTEDAALAACKRPKVEGPANINCGDVHIGISTDYAPVFGVGLTNFGTANFAVSSFDLEGANPISFSYSALSPALKPGEELVNAWNAAANAISKGLYVIAKPKESGAQTATLILNKATDNIPIPLLENGFLLFAHLVMDVSYSMDNSVGADMLKKIKVASQSAMELNNWVNSFSTGRAWLGLTTFPNLVSGDSGVPIIINKEDSNHGPINAFLLGLSAPGDYTPLQAGIVAARNDIQGHTAGLGPLKKALLLLTDGKENGGSHARDEILPTKAADIHVFSVGVGNPGDFDEALLKDLADPGWFTQAVPSNPNAVKKAFVSAAKNWLHLQTVDDPPGTIRPGVVRTHKICIENAANGITFSVDWDRVALGGIDFSLVSPLGEVITPASTDLYYYSGDSFAQYVIMGGRLRGGNGAGQWTMRLAGGSSLPAASDTTYIYNVMVQSTVIAESNFDTLKLDTGAAAAIRIALSGLLNEELLDLAVTAQFEAPKQSFRNWLATNAIPAEWLLQNTPIPDVDRRDDDPVRAALQGVEPKRDIGLPTSVAGQKYLALRDSFGRTFEESRAVLDLPAFASVADGIVSLTTPVIAHDGVYHVDVHLAGTLASGGCITRHLQGTRFVEATLSPNLLVDSIESVEYGRGAFFDPRIYEILGDNIPGGSKRTVLKVTPRDKSGNLFGVGAADRIKCEITGGEPVGRVIDNWDGTYLQVVQFPSDTTPTAVLTVNGVTTPAVPVGVASPKLQITRREGSLLISWVGGGWVLEETPALGRDWAPVNVTDNPYKVPTAAQGNRFYRLRR